MSTANGYEGSRSQVDVLIGAGPIAGLSDRREQRLLDFLGAAPEDVGWRHCTATS